MMAIVGYNPEVRIIDQFQGEHTKADFAQISPCQTVPVVVDGNFKVLGSTLVFLNYLANAKPKLQKLFPSEIKSEIQAHLNWFAAVLRPCVKRLTSMLVGPKAFAFPEQPDSEV